MMFIVCITLMVVCIIIDVVALIIVIRSHFGLNVMAQGGVC